MLPEAFEIALGTSLGKRLGALLGISLGVTLGTSLGVEQAFEAGVYVHELAQIPVISALVSMAQQEISCRKLVAPLNILPCTFTNMNERRKG